MVESVELEGDGELTVVIEAENGAAVCSGAVQGWEEQGSEDADNCDDGEEFEEGKAGIGGGGWGQPAGAGRRRRPGVAIANAGSELG
jgi:hypothetical protein